MKAMHTHITSTANIPRENDIVQDSNIQRLRGGCFHTRTMVCALWMQEGIPMSKIGILQRIQRLGQPFSLPDRSVMSAEYVPIIHKLVTAKLTSELADRELAIFFDGTGFFGEAFAIVARFVDVRGDIQERLMRLRMLDCSMDGKAIAQCIYEAMERHGVNKKNVLFFGSDGASSNATAFGHLDFICSTSHHIVCISHTLNNAGKTHTLDRLKEFLRHWNAVFMHSVTAKQAWNEQTQSTAQPTASNTRWWASFEQALYLHSRWQHVAPFMRGDFTFTLAARQNLLDFLHIHEREVRAQIAGLVDLAQMLVKITYFIEGKRPLGVALFRCVRELCAHLTEVRFTELDKFLSAYPADGDMLREQVISQLQPIIDYFLKRFGGDDCTFASSLRLFEAASLADPARFRLAFGNGSVENRARIESMVKRFRFYENSPSEVTDLMNESGLYFAATGEGVAGESLSDVLDNLPSWWKAQHSLFAWRKFAMRMFLLQPSSASVERVFSILAGAFGKDQASSLSDYLEGTMMMKVNVPDVTDMVS